MRKASKPAAVTDPARKQAVIYARVSSKKQEKEVFSIPAQLKLLKEYAAANGFVVAQEYVDVETAKQTGRTAFGEMVAYLKAHPSIRVMLVFTRARSNGTASSFRASTSHWFRSSYGNGCRVCSTDVSPRRPSEASMILPSRA